LQVGGVVRAEQGDPIPLAHPQAAQRVSESGDPLGELGIGPALLSETDRDPLRAQASPPVRPGPHTLVVHERLSSRGGRLRAVRSSPSRLVLGRSLNATGNIKTTMIEVVNN